MLEVQLLKEGLIAIFQVCNYFEKINSFKRRKIKPVSTDRPAKRGNALIRSGGTWFVSRGAC